MSATTPDPGQTTIRLGMLLALYAVPLVVTLRPVADPVYDPDIWWHLRVGQWVVEQGRVPSLSEPDPFSQANRPWVGYSWLYEVLIFELYRLFGLVGIVLYRAFLALAVVAALHRLVMRSESRFLFATGWTAAAVMALAMLFSERPWLFTVLFSTLTLQVILDLRAGRTSWLFWILPLIYVLWANIHIQFIYGLFLLGLGCVAPWIDRFLGERGLSTLCSSGLEAQQGADAPRSPQNQGAYAPRSPHTRLILLTVACFLATFINPYHAYLYAVVVDVR